MVKLIVFFWRKVFVENHCTLDKILFALEIGQSLRANMVVNQAGVHLRFARLQLVIDLHSLLDGKLLHRKLLIQHLIVTPTIQDIFLISPACRTLIILDSVAFAICQFCSVKECSFVVAVGN